MARPRRMPTTRLTTPSGGLKIGRKLDEQLWISM
jgi:hypothetical protein